MISGLANCVLPALQTNSPSSSLHPASQTKTCIEENHLRSSLIECWIISEDSARYTCKLQIHSARSSNRVPPSCHASSDERSVPGVTAAVEPQLATRRLAPAKVAEELQRLAVARSTMVECHLTNSQVMSSVSRFCWFLFIPLFKVATF